MVFSAFYILVFFPYAVTVESALNQFSIIFEDRMPVLYFFDIIGHQIYYPAMSHISRIVVPGYPHHITQRVVRSMDIFYFDEDRHAYL